jgi:hypothetical protein
MDPPVPGTQTLPELHKRSARPENCQRPTKRVRPDGAENSRHAIACGERERFGDEVFGGIIDDVVAAGVICPKAEDRPRQRLKLDAMSAG